MRRALGARVGEATARELPAAMPFAELGIDSLDIVFVVAEVERKLNRRLPTAGDLGEVAGSVDALVRHFDDAPEAGPFDGAPDLNGDPEPGGLNGIPEAGGLNGVPEEGRLDSAPEASHLTGAPEASHLTGAPEEGRLDGVSEPGRLGGASEVDGGAR